MYGSLFLRIGTYLLHKSVGKVTVRDGVVRLESIRDAIALRIDEVKKTSELEAIRVNLAEIEEADEKVVRSEKIATVLEQVSELNKAVSPASTPATDFSGDTWVNKISKNIFEASLLKWVVAAFFAILLFYPSLIKSSIETSDLGGTFSGALSTISKNVRTVKVGNWELGLGVAQDVNSAASGLKNIDLNKVTDPDTQQKLKEAIGRLTSADNTIKNEIVQNDKSIAAAESEGWVFLGKTRDKVTIENATIDKLSTTELKPTSKITFMESVYLRQERKECPRATGEIITAIPVGETVTIQGDAALSYCPIPNTDYISVWVKVKRN